jgi:misacylated tRNA(Ala) deacylase
MTTLLFLEDSYRQDAPAAVIEITQEGGIILDNSLFYATSGGQPGDGGLLLWADTQMEIETTIKGDGGTLVCMPVQDQPPPKVGQVVTQRIDWELRYSHMRMHTALHLLSVAIPLPVTGGGITAVKGRLDFDMPDAPEEKDMLSARMNDLIARSLDITETWITEAELELNPTLVKTLSVKPPKGAGKIRLIRIGSGTDQIDLQPCGGTHVKNTDEIGKVRISKIEKKGRQNRRVHLVFEE